MLLTIGYLFCFVYLISKRKFSTTLAALIYTGPVLAVILHLHFPTHFFIGGGNLDLQTSENAQKLLLIAFLGILGLSVAYIKPSKLNYSLPCRKLNLSILEIIFWSMVALMLLIYIMPSAKIFHSGYHYSNAGQQELPGLKVGRNIAHSVLAVVFVSMAINRNKYTKYYVLFIGFVLVYFEILSGVRSEAIGLIAALVAYKLDLNKIYESIYWKKVESQKKIYFIFFAIIVLVYIIGKIRTGGVVTVSTFSTHEAVASSFLSAVHLIDGGYMDFLYGKTYLDLIPQTLPQSIYPDRPMVPAQFILHTPYASSGGAFIAGTAYMNFWLFGPFVVMFVFGKILQIIGNGLTFSHAFKQVIYLSFVMSFFRLMYYSELSTYKMLIVGGVVFIMIYVTNYILINSIDRNVK